MPPKKAYVKKMKFIFMKFNTIQKIIHTMGLTIKRHVKLKNDSFKMFLLSRIV